MKTQKRRRKENRTNYSKRYRLLRGKTPRLVFRRTNKQVIAQYVESLEAQDKIIFEIKSSELSKYGWPKSSEGSLKSIPASYLTGLIVGNEIKKRNLKKPIIDFGMLRMIKKNKNYAFIKGIIDAGVEIECKKETFPEESRIKGEKLKSKIDFEAIKSKINGK